MVVGGRYLHSTAYHEHSIGMAVIWEAMAGGQATGNRHNSYLATTVASMGEWGL